MSKNYLKHRNNKKGFKGESMKSLTVIKEQEVLGKTFIVYGNFENPLFLAKDVAEWIDHSNARMMLQSVDDEEKQCVNNPYALKGQQDQWFLTEDGLYEVLMQSRKPIAKAFKKQVKKILKDIRITGFYMSENQQLKARNEEQHAMIMKLLDMAVSNSNYTNTEVEKPIKKKFTRSNPVYLTYNGETKRISQWARDLGIERHTLSARLKRGWTVEETLSITLHGERQLMFKSEV